MINMNLAIIPLKRNESDYHSYSKPRITLLMSHSSHFNREQGSSTN